MSLENNILVNDDLNNKILTFYVKDVLYGIKLHFVTEIISIQYITKVPNIPNYVKGIINLRGKIVPVMDSRLKLELEEKEYDEKTCIIVINLNEMQIGIVVDSVSEVITVDTESLTNIPEITSSNNGKFLTSVTKINGQMVLNLDLASFINDDLIEDLSMI